MDEVILSVQDLSIGVEDKNKAYNIVDHINFHINKEEILGIVGESGCGKSLTALSIQGLLASGIRIRSGQIIFEGKDLLKLSKNERCHINGNQITMIFQEPMVSLNPLMKIGKQIGEVWRIHKSIPKKQVEETAINALMEVGLLNPHKIMDSYPHQLSGGMRQRIMIAMAIVCEPRLLIADEPTTALDVTTQAQMLKLLQKINREHKTSILFISHDLGVINRFCDRVMVMYAGKVVEKGKTSSIMVHPVHEYTKGLMQSIPTRKQKGRLLNCIDGHVPSVTEEKMPCPFAPRCRAAADICYQKAPGQKELSNGHAVCCHIANLEEEMEYYRI